MTVEAFIARVMEIANDGGIREEFEKGLQIQFTIDKTDTNIIALMPKDNPEEDVA